MKGCGLRSVHTVLEESKKGPELDGLRSFCVILALVWTTRAFELKFGGQLVHC